MALFPFFKMKVPTFSFYTESCILCRTGSNYITGSNTVVLKKI